MPDERSTLTNAVRREIKKRREAGQPVWGRKLHGSMYQRDLPDWLFCVGGLFVVIETKHPTDARARTTEGQDTTLRDIARAGGRAIVCNNIEEVRAALDRALVEAGEKGSAAAVLAVQAARGPGPRGHERITPLRRLERVRDETLAGSLVLPGHRVRVIGGEHGGTAGKVVETDRIDGFDEALVALPDGQRVWFSFSVLRCPNDFHDRTPSHPGVHACPFCRGTWFRPSDAENAADARAAMADTMRRMRG